MTWMGVYEPKKNINVITRSFAAVVLAICTAELNRKYFMKRLRLIVVDTSASSLF